MRELKRDYVFEFAGMPRSGKSTIVDIIGHFLKREGFSIQEYDGGSKHNPLSDADIGILNLVLAGQTVELIASAVGSKTKAHKIYLLDRGLIDRFIFTEALLQEGKIDEVEAKRVYDFLTLPRLLKRIDGVFVFVTSPELALARENVNKLVKSSGEVMNEKFLTTLYTATLDGYNYSKERMRNVHLINTDREDRRVHETAVRVRDYILDVL